MEEYQEVGKSFWDLVEGQKRNIMQLERIEAVVEWRWSLEGENEKQENKDHERRSEDGSGES